MFDSVLLAARRG